MKTPLISLILALLCTTFLWGASGTFSDESQPANLAATHAEVDVIVHCLQNASHEKSLRRNGRLLNPRGMAYRMPTAGAPM
jgi:hypothetical protein